MSRATGSVVRVAANTALDLLVKLIPSVRPVVFDAAAHQRWRQIVECADRFDIFPDDEPIPYSLTDKASV